MAHPEAALGFLEALFDRPAQGCRPVQFFLWCIGRSVAEGELELSISEAADVEPDVMAGQIVPALSDPEHLDIGDYGALCPLRQDHPLPGDTVIRYYSLETGTGGKEALNLVGRWPRPLYSGSATSGLSLHTSVGR